MAASDPSLATSDPTTTSSDPPPRPYHSSTIAPPLPTHVAAQSILGRPPSNHPPPPKWILYPVRRSIRGFPPKAASRAKTADQFANPAGYIRNNSPTKASTIPAAPQARSFGFPTDRPAPLHQMRLPSPTPQAQQPAPQFVVPRPVGGGGGGGSRPPPKGVPDAAVHPKVTSFPAISSNPEFNNFNDLRDKSIDDTVVLIYDRKVRLVDGASGSLYALCRSWIRNGLPQESQPNFGDGVKYLPSPLPIKVINTPASKKNEGDGEDEDLDKEEHAGSVDNLSTRDLLDGHIKRAKRVRARLREEQLQRIERYQQRLSLLLALTVE